MEYFDAVEKRASVRAMAPCEVPQEDLVKILDAGLRAPTAFTIEPWHFVVVRSREKLEALGKVQGTIANAGAAIVAIGDPSRSDFWREDVSAAVTQMHLAATAMDYAALWVAVLDRSLVSPVLQLPPTLVPLAIMPIGKESVPTTQAARKPMAELVSDETFGKSFQA